MKTFAVVDHIFFSLLGGDRLGLHQLSQFRKRGLVGKVILAGSHDLDAERPSFRRDSSSCDQVHLGIFQNLN
jgi:hypothetical protein